MPDGLGERAPHARGGGELVLRPVAAEDLPDLEQRHVGEAAVGVPLRAAIRPGSRLGRMSERSAAIGLASASSALPPPNSSACGLAMNDQVTASTMPRAASARLALRVRICTAVRIGLRALRAAVERRRRHAVDADDAHHLFDDVGLAVHVRPPRRHRDLHGLVLPGDQEAEPVEHAAHLRERHVEAAEALQLRRAGNRSTSSGTCGSPATVISDGVPPQRSSTICVASSSPGTRKAGSTPRSKR